MYSNLGNYFQQKSLIAFVPALLVLISLFLIAVVAGKFIAYKYYDSKGPKITFRSEIENFYTAPLRNRATDKTLQ
jgi:hypothetical protein